MRARTGVHQKQDQRKSAMSRISCGRRYAANTIASTASAATHSSTRRSGIAQAPAGAGRAIGCSRIGRLTAAAATPSAIAIHQTMS